MKTIPINNQALLAASTMALCILENNLNTDVEVKILSDKKAVINIKLEYWPLEKDFPFEVEEGITPYELFGMVQALYEVEIAEFINLIPVTP